MIQIDGIRRQVFIKFTDLHFVHDIIYVTNGETVYKHNTGENFPVRIMIAGMGTKGIRLANLPPELSSMVIQSALSQYGEILLLQDETWA
jgi:hypothetical protein